ncbi:45519_t:CDS:1, partial [Gigaspora margarita]
NNLLLKDLVGYRDKALDQNGDENRNKKSDANSNELNNPCGSKGKAEFLRVN